MKVRSDSKEQTMTDFIIVTAMQLLNGTEPGGILFPMSYWTLVPDSFGLDIHAVLLSADLREGECVMEIPRGLLPIFNLSTAWTGLQTGQHTLGRAEHWEQECSAGKINAEIPTLTEKAAHHGLTAQGLRCITLIIITAALLSVQDMYLLLTEVYRVVSEQK